MYCGVGKELLGDEVVEYCVVVLVYGEVVVFGVGDSVLLVFVYV